MDLTTMPGHLIRRLHQTSVQVFTGRAREAGLDLTPVQFAAMGAIHDDPGIDQATVAERIGYDRATIGGVIDRLETKGLVLRKVSRRDRRARELSLSDNGQAVLARARPLVAAFQPEILGALDAAETAQFLALARRALRIDESGGRTG
ncbi:MarR family transcriptional regulator [Sulfitobacter sp. LCG007]